MTGFIYEQLRTKWGFDDATWEPYNIEEAREALIDFINKNLPPDCPVEAYAFDRPGMHNHCLLLYRKKGNKPDPSYNLGKYCGEEPEPSEVGDILYEAEAEEKLCFHLKIEVTGDG